MGAQVSPRPSGDPLNFGEREGNMRQGSPKSLSGLRVSGEKAPVFLRSAPRVESGTENFFLEIHLLIPSHKPRELIRNVIDSQQGGAREKAGEGLLNFQTRQCGCLFNTLKHTCLPGFPGIPQSLPNIGWDKAAISGSLPELSNPSPGLPFPQRVFPV